MIREEELKKIKCCFYNDGHIAIEPILVSCGATGCKECVHGAKEESIHCNSCKRKHEKKDLINQQKLVDVENIVNSNLNDLFEYVKMNLEKTSDLLKEESLIYELNSKIESIENEMDIRVESLVTSIYNYRDEYKIKLEKIKEDFKPIIETKSSVSISKNKLEETGNTIEELKELQNELKSYQLKLNDYRKDLNELKFVPSKFEFDIELFGFVKDHVCWLNDSLILTKEESSALAEMTKSIRGSLLYRATRDGFESEVFHEKCDGKSNTISIIWNNLNYVFGGYASSAWNSSGKDINDPNAFIFSLRRKGVSFKDKFVVKDAGAALFGHIEYGPTFSIDIEIRATPNIKNNNNSHFGKSYELPDGYIYDKNAREYLAGYFSFWKTTEIEVYQII